MTAYLIVMAWVVILAIGVIQQAGGNIRAVFGAGSNCLAGSESCVPDSRPYDQSADPGNQARRSALQQALDDPDARRHFDFQRLPNVHPQVAANLRKASTEYSLFGEEFRTAFNKIIRQATRESVRQLKTTLRKSLGLPAWIDTDLGDWRFYLCLYKTPFREAAEAKVAELGNMLADKQMRPVVHPMNGGFAVLHDPCGFDLQDDQDGASNVISDLLTEHPGLWGEVDLEKNGVLPIRLIGGSRTMGKEPGCARD